MADRAVLEELIAVVGGDDDQRVVGQAEGVELVEDPCDHGVDPGELGLVHGPEVLQTAVVDHAGAARSPERGDRGVADEVVAELGVRIVPVEGRAELFGGGVVVVGIEEVAEQEEGGLSPFSELADHGVGHALGASIAVGLELDPLAGRRMVGERVVELTAGLAFGGFESRARLAKLLHGLAERLPVARLVAIEAPGEAEGLVQVGARVEARRVVSAALQGLGERRQGLGDHVPVLLDRVNELGDAGEDRHVRGQGPGRGRVGLLHQEPLFRQAVEPRAGRAIREAGVVAVCTEEIRPHAVEGDQHDVGTGGRGAAATAAGEGQGEGKERPPEAEARRSRRPLHPCSIPRPLISIPRTASGPRRCPSPRTSSRPACARCEGCPGPGG